MNWSTLNGIKARFKETGAHKNASYNSGAQGNHEDQFGDADESTYDYGADYEEADKTEVKVKVDVDDDDGDDRDNDSSNDDETKEEKLSLHDKSCEGDEEDEEDADDVDADADDASKEDEEIPNHDSDADEDKEYPETDAEMEMDMGASESSPKDKDMTIGDKKKSPSIFSRDFRGGQETWNSMLFQLLVFKSKKGDLNVPHNDPKYKQLYYWVQNQRKHYKLYRGGNSSSTYLTQERVAVLDSINFQWNIRGDGFWQRHYESLKIYKEEIGDAKVPRLYGKNPKLGEWVTDQRRQYKAKCEGKTSLLTDERKRKLDEIGFVWKVRDRADWNDRYEQLLEFKKESGHCVVPQHFPHNRALGKWVAKQREQYRFYKEGRHSFLTEERIDLLNSIGFTWRVKGRGLGNRPIGPPPALKTEAPVAISSPPAPVAPATVRNRAAALGGTAINIPNASDHLNENIMRDSIHNLPSTTAMSSLPTSAMPSSGMSTLGMSASGLPGSGMSAQGLQAMTPYIPQQMDRMESKFSPMERSMERGQSSLSAQKHSVSAQQHAATAAAVAAIKAHASSHPGHHGHSSRTMADIAAALASVPHFGDSLSAAAAAGMVPGYPSGRSFGSDKPSGAGYPRAYL